MKALTVALLMLISLFAYDITYADSDGAVAFGDGYVVFTRFAPLGGQTLNVVPFDSEGPLDISSAVPLPVSYSTIVTHNKTVFIRWWEKLYIFEIDKNWEIILEKQFDLPKPRSMYFENEKTYAPMRSNGKYLLLFNKPNNQILDLATYENLIEVEDISVYLENDTSHGAFSKDGDWISKNGPCVTSNTKTLCLSTSQSYISHGEGASTIYHDKLLIMTNRTGTTNSKIHVNRSKETVH